METYLTLSFLLNIFFFFLSQSSFYLILENITLRQQLAILISRKPHIRTKPTERWYLILFSKLFRNWQSIIAIVQPQTVLRWHKNFIRVFWKWISKKKKIGRPNINQELISIIHFLAKENSLWSPHKIQAELYHLGYTISVNTVRKYMPRKPKLPSPTWSNFLKLHCKHICAMDFFTVPSISSLRSPFFCLFIMAHHSRKILHVAVTRHPNLDWLKQQIREAFPGDLPKYLLSDNEPVFKAIKDWLSYTLNISSIFTAYRSPWQNSIAERWVRTCREELTNHIIPLSENHLCTLLREFADYYNQDRIHTSLNKSPPCKREVQFKKKGQKLITLPRVRGLHNRYKWEDAA